MHLIRFENEFWSFIYHSTWQMLVQVMKTTRGFPLTPGRWVHMWLKNANFEMFWWGYLTKKLVFNKVQVIKWPKIARFWSIWNYAYCDWVMHIHGLLLMRRVHWNWKGLKVVFSWVNCKMMHLQISAPQCEISL